MKILRLTTLLDFGGQERKYISFTEDASALHHQYVFAAIGFGGHAEQLLRERGFEVHILNRRAAIRNLSNIWAVYRLIKKVRPDVVHTAAAEANFHGIIAAKLAGVKVIIGEEIGIPNHSNTAQKIFRWVYRWATEVVCVSQSVKKHLYKTKELPADKGTVVYNPAHMAVAQSGKQKSSNGPLQIVYLGRLEKVKNVATLIRAFAVIAHEKVKLVLVGDGREREHLVSLAAELKIPHDKICFAGFSNNPSEFLQDADLFVLPSYSEGFGIAAVEAMLLKVPVLCSRVGGIPEFVADNETGWLFDPKSTEELTVKLLRIIALSELQRNLIGNKGYEFVNGRFTIEKYVQNLELLYERLARQ